MPYLNNDIELYIECAAGMPAEFCKRITPNSPEFRYLSKAMQEIVIEFWENQKERIRQLVK